MRRFPLLGLALALLVAAAGCGSSEHVAVPLEAPGAPTGKVSVSPDGWVAADGIATFSVELSIVNGAGKPLAGMPVAVEASGSGNVIEGPATTDAAGRAAFTVASTVAETKYLRFFAAIEGERREIAPARYLTFVAAGAAGLVLDGAPTVVEAGKSFSLRVLVIDGSGNGRGGVGVNVSLETGELLGTTMATSDQHGIAAFPALRIEETTAAAKLVVRATELAPITSAPFAVVAGAPASLAFGTEPGDVIAGEPLPTIEVALRDAFGNVASGSHLVRLGVADGVAELVGTTEVQATGVARFSGLSIERAAPDLRLVASLDGLDPVISAPFTVRAAGADEAASSLELDAESVVAGMPVGVSFTLRDRFGNPKPNILVTFVASGADNTFTPAQTVGTDAEGRAEATFVSTRAELKRIGATTTLDDLWEASLVVLPGAPDAESSSSSGSDQMGTVNQPLAEPLVLMLRDGFGNPAPGVAVTFSADAGIVSAPATTDENGEIAATWQLGTAAGAQHVTASVPGWTAPIVWTATARAGAPASLAAISGDGQTGTVNSQLAQPLVAIARDAWGNPVPGVEVFFVGPGPSAHPGSVISGADGLVQTQLTLGTVAGTQSIQLMADLVQPATFTFTATPGAPAGFELASGNGQQGRVHELLPAPLEVRVTDAFGNPVQQIQVEFAALDNNGSLDPSVAVTGADGIASTRFTLGDVAGQQIVRASSSGLGAIDFRLDAIPAAPATLVGISGDGQHGTVATAAAPLVVEARDAFGNRTPGVQVTFAITAGQGSLASSGVNTDADGRASGLFTFAQGAGAATVQATLGTSSVPFSLVAEAGPAASVAAVSGDGGSTTVGGTRTLVVEVVDSYGNAVAGAPVVFSSDAGVSFAPTQLPTDSNGRASTLAQLGTAAGAVTVQATTGSLAPATYSFVATPGAPAALASVGAGPTPVQVNGTFAPWTVRLTDAYGNPIAGVPATFAVTGGDAALLSASAATDARGEASATVLAGTHAGAVQIEAMAAGLAAIAQIEILAGPAAQLVALPGPTSAVVATSVPLEVHVADGYGNPVAGQPITASPDGGVVQQATVVSDGDGVASFLFTLGDQARTYAVDFTTSGAAGTRQSILGTPAAPAILAVVGGDGQTGTPNVEFPLPYVVEVRDDYGNGIPSIAVSFASDVSGSFAPAAGGISDASGRVSVRHTPGAVYGSGRLLAHATVPAFPAIPAASFAGTVEPNAPASITLVSGNNQSGTVNTPLAQPLVVRLTDRFGNPVPGTSVSFVVTGGSASLPAPSVNSDGNGFAQMPLIPTAAGTITIEARFAGVAPAVFTALAAPDAMLQRVAGNNVLARPGSTVSLVVRVVDHNGNPVANQPVSFAVAAGGLPATFAPASAPSDAQGYAWTAATMAPIPGTTRITASIAGSKQVPFVVEGRAEHGRLCAYQGGGQLRTFDGAQTTRSSTGNWRLVTDSLDWTYLASEAQVQLLNGPPGVPAMPVTTLGAAFLFTARSNYNLKVKLRFYSWLDGFIRDDTGFTYVLTPGQQVVLLGMPSDPEVLVERVDAERWRIRSSPEPGAWDEYFITTSDGAIASVYADLGIGAGFRTWGLCGDNNGDQANDAGLAGMESSRPPGAPNALFPN